MCFGTERTSIAMTSRRCPAICQSNPDRLDLVERAERNVHGDTVERFAWRVPVGQRQLDVALPPHLGKVGKPDSYTVFAIGKELFGEIEESTVALALLLPPSIEPTGVSDVGIETFVEEGEEHCVVDKFCSADASRHGADAIEEFLVPGDELLLRVPFPRDQCLGDEPGPRCIDVDLVVAHLAIRHDGQDRTG